MEKLLTPERICEILGIRMSTLYFWTSRNRIPYVKVNGLLRFRESEITKWLQTKERGNNIIERKVESILGEIRQRKENG